MIVCCAIAELACFAIPPAEDAAVFGQDARMGESRRDIDDALKPRSTDAGRAAARGADVYRRSARLQRAVPELAGRILAPALHAAVFQHGARVIVPAVNGDDTAAGTDRAGASAQEHNDASNSKEDEEEREPSDERPRDGLAGVHEYHRR